MLHRLHGFCGLFKGLCVCVFISGPAPSPPLERQVLHLTDKYVSDIP